MVLLEVLTDARTLGPLLLTLRVLALAGCILLPGGVLLAYFLSGKPSALRVVVDFIVSIPLVFPPIATGFILLMLLGRNGFMGRVLPEVVFAFPGLVLASVISGLPLLVDGDTGYGEALNVMHMVRVFEEAGARDSVKIMIGGAPITHSFCTTIGADRYTPDAGSAAEVALELITQKAA